MLPEITALGSALTRCSIWLALIGYLAGPCAALVGRRHPSWQQLARGTYTTGFIAFLIHVAAAFHYFYDWSHSLALARTAADTAEVTGLNSAAGLYLNYSAAGLYLNYAFTLLWGLDVVWWWRVGTEAFRRRRIGFDVGFHAFFLFMAFNATVIFEQGSIRWAAVAATLGLTALAVKGLLRK